VSLLSSLGADFKKVFTWLGTPKAQSVITTAEAVEESVANAVDPALAGIDPLISNWTQEIFKSEALAAAAGVQNGTGVQKSAMVLSAVVPQITSFVQANTKLSAPAATDVSAFNDALVKFLNAFGSTAPAA
jgi:hypothetical protein